MKERPILFSGPMVQAILAGHKTQTRRAVKPQPPCECSYVINGAQNHALCYHASTTSGGKFTDKTVWVPPTGTSKDHRLPCPYGQPGDRLWVREAWRITTKDNHPTLGYRFGEQCVPGYHGTRLVGGLMLSWAELKRCDDCWRSPIHMPRWASRITLEITAVRVERLQAITRGDVQREGVEEWAYGNKGIGQFSAMWDKINGKSHPWASNPWVWVVEFRKAVQS